MKKLQQLFASVVLTLIFSVSTFAVDGIITTWPKAGPAPVTATSNEDEAAGTIHTGRSASVDPVTEVVLSVLPSVLALF
jgi:hypothetical protein